MKWQFSSFDGLALASLYVLLQARQEVFIIEQQCFYNDFDGYDQAAHHLLGWLDGGKLGAYLRVIAPGVKYPEMSLGRILTTEAARGRGAGRALVAEGIARAEALYPGNAIRIGAQSRLEAFYNSFGFERCSPEYDEDGIPHIEMIRACANA